MWDMNVIFIVAVIFTVLLLLFLLQLSSKGMTVYMIAYASTGAAGNNTAQDVPNLITTPPPLLYL
ncbi:MAG TPA: hypothetical protein VFS97_07160 [Nitrososphaeraceae archaeon]|nr:hypothetical protein [Nitrososphaeraceae archaeon]